MLDNQMSIADFGLWSGKTFQGPSVVTTVKTSAPYSKKPFESSNLTPLFLDLRGGYWSDSGVILGRFGSIAWRVHDSQFWGVPQRRRRIALIVDITGQSAPEILFERKSVSRDLEAGGESWEGTSRSTSESADSTSFTLKIRSGKEFDSNGRRSGKGPLVSEELANTLSITHDQTLIQTPKVFKKMKHETAGVPQKWTEGEVSDTLNRFDNSGLRTPTLIVEGDTYCFQGAGSTSQTAHGDGINKEVAFTLNSMENHAVGYTETVGALTAAEVRGANRQYVARDKVVITPVVRRLTPLECERLQGFPDGWTDIGDWTDTKGKKHKTTDTPRIKALGNSLALPFWEWLARRMVDVLRQDGIESPTMASLFDGIGGFPLVYSRAGCLPVWASEIEEFPIAVTKYHFGGE